MKILILSPYHTHSHAYWCRRLMEGFPEYNWTLQSLPARNFAWRIRGNALSWFGENREVFQRTYDVVLATSMTDLASLLALFPKLHGAKKVLYFHENQFAYPLSEKKQHSNVESMMVQLYSALAADRVVFNSQYNQETMLSGARELLRRINDHSPREILRDIEEKSSILPVPIASKPPVIIEKIPRSILWNHRWEYDKNPEDFLRALEIIKAQGLEFKLMLMGLEFRNKPEAMKRIMEQFQDQLLCQGQQNEEEYLHWLNRASLVVSTAIHEFQGLAVMEAVQHGAHPLVPDRLSYPQWFSREFRYGQSPEDLAAALMTQLKTPPSPPDLSRLCWPVLKEKYRSLLER